MTAKPKLTDLDVEVLRAAAREDGSVWRDDHSSPFPSYLAREGAGRNNRKNVNAQVDKLCHADLLRPGDRERFHRPWLITAAGRVVLDAHPEEQP